MVVWTAFVLFDITQENKPVGVSVLKLVVTDKDSSHNGPPFFFTIVSGNDDNTFEVNQHGVLLTAAAIKKKEKDHYLLHVKVSQSFFVVLLGFIENSFLTCYGKTKENIVCFPSALSVLA